MKASFVSFLLLTLLGASSLGMAQEAPMVHKCLRSFNLTECSKLQCVEVCVDNGTGWENGACLDEYLCCCKFAMM